VLCFLWVKLKCVLRRYLGGFLLNIVVGWTMAMFVVCYPSISHSINEYTASQFHAPHLTSYLTLPLYRGRVAACVDCYFIARAWNVTGQSRNCLLLFAVEISFHRASLDTTICHHAPTPTPPPLPPPPFSLAHRTTSVFASKIGEQFCN